MYVYDKEQADRAVAFIERYVIPSTTGKRLRLLDWQRDFIQQLYGQRHKDTGRRRYRKAILSTAKKQGKNLLTSAICLYELYGNTTPSPFVVSASTTRENAGQIYREIAYSVRNNPNIDKISKTLDSTKEVRVKSKNARYKAFSADSGSAEGENISCLVVDELHAHSNDKLYRSLEHSTIARPDGLTVIISTAGHDQSSLWYELFRYAQGVENGSIQDDTLLARIYTSNPEDDIDDPQTWRKANPSLGVSFTEDDFRKDLERAKNEGTSALLSFKRYRLNQWVIADDAYIDGVKFDRCIQTIPDHELKQYPLYVGVDLSQTTDPCSVSLCFALPDRRFYIRNHAWVCEEGVKRREESNLPKYRTYEADGVMTITKGTANDYRQIKSYLLNLRNQFNLKEIIFDQYNALEMCAELMAEGITVFRMPQNHRHYTGPVKELEIAITEERVKFQPNKLLRWSLQNTRLDHDAYENVKPSRDKSTDKIDPTISTLMAFSRAVTAQVTAQPKRSVYDGRGLFVC